MSNTNGGNGNGAHGVKLPIYMDNHATTPLDPRVLEAMMPYLTEVFGNAASRNHEFGWRAEQAVDVAREQIAKLIGASAKEIIFTSGATESNNLALKGVAEMYREKGNHIITQVIEHKATLDSCKRLEKDGFRVTYLPVQKDGRIDMEDLKRAMDDKTILVSIMAPITRSARCNRFARSASFVTSAESFSTPTPCRSPARLRSTSLTTTWTWLRSPVTRFMDQKV